jgi:bifunctional DNA-binding transcriptional regulator/antitoxin component of YhaV-PrlF toxin-antitoxin module
MSEKTELSVGMRGEIYTTKEMRKKVGLKPGEKAIATIENGKLVIEPKPSAASLLRKPRVNAPPLDPEELSQLRRNLADRIETG